MKIEVCFSPALYKYYVDDNDILVVVADIFRATTSMCAAFNNGAKSIIPVASIEEAQLYKEKGYLVGAERNVKRCSFADFGNSPFDYTADRVKDQEIVFTTTNGTIAIEEASQASYLTIGAFSNLNALAQFCIDKQKNVLILCAGWNNRFNIEDSLFAGALSELLIEEGSYSPTSDSVKVSLSIWEEAKNNLRLYINRSEHIKRLEANHLENSVDYCLSLNTVNLVPVYDKQSGKLILEN